MFRTGHGKRFARRKAVVPVGRDGAVERLPTTSRKFTRANDFSGLTAFLRNFFVLFSNPDAGVGLQGEPLIEASTAIRVRFWR